MTILKWISFGILFIGLILLIFAYAVIKRGSPTLAGVLSVSDLKSPVKVIRDIYGIPHIFAENSHDLFFTQGFVTAQDRLWQMDFTRRVAQGRLSEIFGDRTVDIDYFLRALEITEVAEKLYYSLDVQTKNELISYANGVNNYISSGKRPIESIILRYDMEKWRPTDSISIHLLSALELSLNMEEEIFILNALKILDENRANELFSEYEELVRTSLPKDTKGLDQKFELTKGYEAARDELGFFIGKGASNSWVIDGTKSYSGKPILANDPHLRIQIPSVWHEVHLLAPGINVIGATFPGTPFILIGHNERVAWGFTDAMADRMDLFIEKIDSEIPYKYWYMDELKDLKTKKVKIRVKNGRGYKELTKDIQYTRHGPIISSLRSGIDEVLSMAWSARVVQDQTLKGLSVLNKSKSVKDIIEGTKYGKIYTQNIVFADVDGNIGYQLMGGIPIRSKGSGKSPVPGWNNEFDWIGFIPHDELPSVINPPSHFIATANNKLIGDDYPFLISNSWASPYRFERIVSILDEKEKFSIEDFKEIQADVYSERAKTFVSEILGIEKKDSELQWVFQDLAGWNYEVSKESRPALLYEVVWFNLIRNIFEDEFKEIFPDFLSNIEFYDNSIASIIKNPESVWWDNVNTSETEARDETLMQSIKDAMKEIEKHLGENKENWNWGAVHKYAFQHPLGRVKLLSYLFNPKPIPAPGDSETINSSYFRIKMPYDVTRIPSYRFIVDLADIDNAISINSTGQSGDPFSERYSDQIENWAKVNYHPMLFDVECIEKNKWKQLILNPD
ncbi:penicillin acylase family protein [Desulfobacterota bacterium AH_259_B03_O07]|nr:penicillin acylase family protein [Desulfobacterota bacterium AH_259_B03_O07]